MARARMRGGMHREEGMPDSIRRNKNRGRDAGNRRKKAAGLKTHEQNEEHQHPMPGNRHTKRPDKSLGRSIAPRGSSRSNCQVKAILHGGIETGAEMRGKAQRQRNERLFVVISTSSPINGDPFELTAASCGAYVQRRVFFRPA